MRTCELGSGRGRAKMRRGSLAPRVWHSRPLKSTSIFSPTVQRIEEPLRLRVRHVCPYMHPSAGGPPVVVERLCQFTPNYGWNACLITTSLLCGDDGRELEQSLRSSLDATVLPADRSRVFGLAS